MADTCDSKEKDLQKLKSEIRSLLISNPAKTVLLNQFLKDYERLIGKSFPYKDFDYKTPLRFLCTLSDVVEVMDASDGARLKPVVNALSGHISAMVDQQKRLPNRRPLYRNITYYPPSSRVMQSTQYGSKTIPSWLNNSNQQLPPQLESAPPATTKPAEITELSSEHASKTESSPPPPSKTELASPHPSKTELASPPPSKTELASPHPSKTELASPPPSKTELASPHPSKTELASPHPSKTELASPHPSKTELASPPITETEKFAPPVSQTESQYTLKTSSQKAASDSIAPSTQSTTKTESSSETTVQSPSPWFPNSDAMSFHPDPRSMTSYSTGQPLYTFGGPVPLMPQPYPPMFGNWPQPQGNPYYGYPGPLPHYVCVPKYASIPRKRLHPRTSASKLSTQTPSLDPVGGQSASTGDTNEIEVAGSNEHINGLPENYGSIKPENFVRRSSQSPINEDINSEEHVAVEGFCPVPEYIVDLPDSTVDGNVDAASLDVQSRGQEHQNYTSSGSFSDTSKCSEFPNSEVKSKIWAVLEIHTNGVPSSSFESLYESLHSCSLDIASLGYSSIKEMILKNEDVFTFEKSKASDDWTLYDARLKPKRRQSQVAFWFLVLNNKWIPHCVVDNLAALARKHPEGIDADKILHLYKDEFSMEINPEILGFNDLLSLLENCKSIALRKYGDKGIVYPKDWVSKSCETSGKDDIKEPALPPPEEMKFLWKDYFKEYECDPSFKFKPPIIPESNLLQVKVVDVHSPGLVWVQFLNDVKSLNLLMYEMNSHYDHEHEDYIIPESFVMAGLAVASIFSGKWHRAVIISVTCEFAEVLYVDYGTICRANVSELRKLDRRFGQHRVYAIKAVLFCLGPFEGDEWSMESCDFLYSEYAEKIIYAEICAVNYQEPFVEVIFFDTSGETEVNINDLLVSNKLARYMTNPASILNEKTVSRFYKFLPRWFSSSNQSNSDPSICYENLMVCTTGASVPLNIDVAPCCKFHCIQQLCQANSESLALVWENAVRQEEERIFNNVLRQIDDSLKEWGWESCLTSKLCCVQEGSQDGPFDSKQVNKTTKQPTSTQISVRSPACEQRRQNHVVRRTKEPTNPQSKSSSRTGFHHAWVPGTRSKVDNRNDSWCGSKLRLKYPRTIRYFEAQIGGTSLTLIGFKGDVWVCLSQLFKMTRLPSMLAKKRLEISDVESDIILVSRRAYPDLFNDLHDLHLTTPEGDPILVLLSDAPTLIRAIDPLGSYQDTFENLAKEVAPLLDELIQ